MVNFFTFKYNGHEQLRQILLQYSQGSAASAEFSPPTPPELKKELSLLGDISRSLFSQRRSLELGQETGVDVPSKEAVRAVLDRVAQLSKTFYVSPYLTLNIQGDSPKIDMRFPSEISSYLGGDLDKEFPHLFDRLLPLTKGVRWGHLSFTGSRFDSVRDFVEEHTPEKYRLEGFKVNLNYGAETPGYRPSFGSPSVILQTLWGEPQEVHLSGVGRDHRYFKFLAELGLEEVVRSSA